MNYQITNLTEEKIDENDLVKVIEKVSDISTRMIVNKVAFKFKKDEIMNIVNQLEKVIGGN